MGTIQIIVSVEPVTQKHYANENASADCRLKLNDMINKGINK